MKSKQHGLVLILTLIVLAIFLIASVGMMKSLNSNIASVGNYAFREAALAISDSENVAAKLFVASSATDLTNNVPGQYSAQTLADTAGDGVPASPCASGPAWDCVPADTTTYAPYSVQYFIERLCNVTGAIANVPASCQMEKPTSNTGGNNAISGGNLDTGAFYSTPVVYRVTVKVAGPKSTSVTTQTFFSQ